MRSTQSVKIISNFGFRLTQKEASLLDLYKHKGQRKKLVDSLREKGIKNEKVLNAMLNVPRHFFVDPTLEYQAYEDHPLRIGDEQTISQPYTVAFQTELLNPKAGMKVLEIGTGSGYQCAILCELGMKVYSIERHRKLHTTARDLLREMNYKPQLKFGDGTVGWPSAGPFDGILVTAAAPRIPATFKRQLAVGGRLIIPVGDREKQRMMIVDKIKKDEFQITELDVFSFVPMIGEEGWPN